MTESADTPAFDLKKERGIDLFLRQAADQFRFLKEAILRGEPFQRGMRALVIASDIGQQAASELFERVKIFATLSSGKFKKASAIKEINL